MKYDCVLIPPEVQATMSQLATDKLLAVKQRYGHLFGIPEGDRTIPITGRKVFRRPYYDWLMVTTDPSLDHVWFPKDHPRTGELRYDLVELEDGCFAGTLKPTVTLDTLPLPPARPKAQPSGSMQPQAKPEPPKAKPDSTP